MNDRIKESGQGILLPIKVIPHSSRNEIIGWENDELKIKLTAIPEKGKANEALVRFLAKLFHLSPSSLTIISGKTNSHKKICIRGMTLTEVIEKLSNF